MLERLGVSDGVLAQSILPRACIMFDALTGTEVTRIPNEPALRARFGHPYVVIHRVDLHQVLLDACRATDGIALEPQTSVTGFVQRNDRVVVSTADGREIDGVALIGADGLRSAVRAQVVDDGEPKPAGYVAHRTIVPMYQVPAVVQRDISALWIGPGFHMVHYPLRHGTLFNIVAVFRAGTVDEKADAALHTAEADRTYRPAHPAMKSLLAMMDLGDRRPRSGAALEQWLRHDPWRCGASGTTDLRARRLHGDRGCGLSGRVGRAKRRRFRRGIPAVRSCALRAHRPCPA
jgi:salicylate hydroxylase